MMHLGNSNPISSGNKGYKSLEAMEGENRLRRADKQTNCFWKVNKEIVARASRVLGLIWVSFECKNKRIFSNLCTSRDTL